MDKFSHRLERRFELGDLVHPNVRLEERKLRGFRDAADVLCLIGRHLIHERVRVERPLGVVRGTLVERFDIEHFSDFSAK